jgi:hypothetical protein
MPREQQQMTSTNALPPVTPEVEPAPLYDVVSTQSLLEALQSTMGGKTTSTRMPVVISPDKDTQNKKQLPLGSARPAPMRIPADRRLASNPFSTRSASKLASNPRQGISVPARYIIVLIIFVLVLLFCLLSLTPIGGGQNLIPFAVGGSLSWVRSQGQIFGVGAPPVAQQQDQGQSVAPLVPAPQVPMSSVQYVALARQDAINAGISPDYFVQQIFVESGFNPNVVSPSGAVGIAQFLPSTAASLGVDPWDPVSALRGASNLMAGYAIQYGGNYAMALAAYNAGSGTVTYAVNVGGMSWMEYLPGETRSYIYKIMGI